MSEEYPEGFKVVDINRNDTCRYSLDIQTPNQEAEKSLFVLMMNPSRGNEKEMDSTIKLLVRHVAPRYNKMIIVNTTPVIKTQSTLLGNYREEIKNEADKNVQIILDKAKEVGKADFLVATGNVKPMMKESYEIVMDRIGQSELGNNMYAIEISGKDFGSHPHGMVIERMEKLTKVEVTDSEGHLKEV